MLSLASFTRFRIIRATAFLALLLFGWQGALQSVAGIALQVTPVAEGPVTVAPAELVPTHTILPLVPVEVAKPAPPERRPSAASPPADLSVLALAERPFHGCDTANESSRHPAAALCPPYAARAPPIPS